MAQEISIELFERNAKLFNRKGLRRKYSSIPLRESEYIRQRPLGASSKYVLEAVIDKDSASDYQDYLKSRGFTILGAKNYYHLENMVEDYHARAGMYEAIRDKMEAIEKDCRLMKEAGEAFTEIENGDVKFYFLPYRDDINNLCEFIEQEKNGILDFCKSKDVTIIMNIIAYSNMVKGFFGFNFYDADQKGDVIIDYSANIFVNVDFSQRNSAYAAALQLSGISENAEDLELMSCHIMAENLKYTKE